MKTYFWVFLSDRLRQGLLHYVQYLKHSELCAHFRDWTIITVATVHIEHVTLKVKGVCSLQKLE